MEHLFDPITLSSIVDRDGTLSGPKLLSVFASLSAHLSQIQSKLKEIEKVSKELHDNDVATHQLQGTVEIVRANIATIQDSISTMQISIDALIEFRGSTMSQLASMESKIDKQDTQDRTLEQHLQDHRAEYQSLGNKQERIVNALNHRLNEVTDGLDTLQKMVVGLEKITNDNNNTIQHMNTLVKTSAWIFAAIFSIVTFVVEFWDNITAFFK